MGIEQSFYLYLNNEQSGPYDRNQIVEMLMQGRITPETPSAVENGSEWVPISSYVQAATKDNADLESLSQQTVRIKLPPTMRA